MKKKKLYLTVPFFILLLIATACSDTMTSLQVKIQEEEPVSRYFTIKVTGLSFEREDKKESPCFHLPGLKDEQARIEVEGYDGNGLLASRKIVYKGLYAGENELTIVLDKTSGKRNVLFKIEKDPAKELEYMLCNSITGDCVESGILQGEEIGFKNLGYSKYILILKDGDQEMKLSFTHDEASPEEYIALFAEGSESSDVGFFLDNASTVPIEGRIRITSYEQERDKRYLEILFTGLSEGIREEDIGVSWYVNGRYLATGRTLEWIAGARQERIDALFYTTRIGSLGSVSVLL